MYRLLSELLSYKGQKIENNRDFSLFHLKLIKHVKDPHPFIFSLCHAQLPLTKSTHGQTWLLYLQDFVTWFQ